ncbi:hypothetical protein ABZQ74_06735 [Pseudomonas aeruginosa]|nr:hypothetical protein [Pseudomonas aeruginosa]EIU4337566.1 hypothetical protein [Pseudomonas aeruginosa]EIU4463277.1 hypothetical protein [Pseudomonas aeruginosa]EIY9708088.1 hypothetical protein [Pseudomonas aeruginosa]EKU9485555.1 hypothetical protein [Pseudomonas aeruginosa]EKU9634804.1 hypothetical protein [Pseudomonas aeruginosa]
MRKTRLVPFTGRQCSTAISLAIAAGMTAQQLVRCVRVDQVWFITFEVPA